MTFNPDFSEQAIVKAVVQSQQLYSVFDSFLVPFYLHSSDSFDEAWIYTEVPSKYLGICSGPPGDIDLLYIPMERGQPQVSNVACAEVKIVRPTKQNPGKDHKDSGRRQILGLVQHGIPIVSLNHIILPETNKKVFGPFHSLATGMELEEVCKHLSGVINERQEGRLRSLGLPKFVGYSAALIEKVGNVLYSSVNHGRFCKRNSDTNPNLEECIVQFVEAHPSPEIKLPGRKGRPVSWDVPDDH